jgi:hypothetical protein
MGKNANALPAVSALRLSINIWCFAQNAAQGCLRWIRSETMKKWMALLLAMAMLLCLCACNNTPDTEDPIKAPTTQGQPDTTEPADPTEPTEPPVPVHPEGVYGCTGLSTEGPNSYNEVDYGELCLYEDQTGDIYFDDYYHEFTWKLEGTQFLAITTDSTPISIEGTLKDGVMELVYEENVYLRFQIKTQQELDQEAVDLLRDWMVDSQMKMAVAYLGWYEGDEDFSTWLSENCPSQLVDYPFIANLPQKQIVGEHGEVYCLVPKDEQAEVTISLLKDDGSGETQKELYHGENGEPLLLLCNFDGSYPNTEVFVRESTGQQLMFYPQTGDMGGVVIPTNDDLEELILDFTYYFEVYPDYFTAMLAQGWSFPDEQYMISTCWNYQEDTPEDRQWILNLSGEGDVQLDLAVDGVTAECYTGTWSLNYSDSTGLVYLWLDLLRDDGEQITVEYVVMKCPFDNGILLGTHEDQEGLPILMGDENESFWWGSVG